VTLDELTGQTMTAEVGSETGQAQQDNGEEDAHARH
jgi:hypothetical protein